MAIFERWGNMYENEYKYNYTPLGENIDPQLEWLIENERQSIVSQDVYQERFKVCLIFAGLSFFAAMPVLCLIFIGLAIYSKGLWFKEKKELSYSDGIVTHYGLVHKV